MRHPSTWHPVAQHATVYGFTAAALILGLVSAAVLEPSYFLPLVASVLISSWFFGLAGGIQATLAGALLANFFLVPPRYSLKIGTHTELAGMIIFLVVAGLTTWLTTAWRNSRHLRESILEGMSDALVVTDRRGNVRYINPAAEALSGFHQEEAKNKPFGDIFTLRDESSGRDRSTLVSETLAGNGAAQTSVQTLLTAKDGTEYFVEEIAAPLRDHRGRISGSIVVLRNVTQRRQIQDQLTQSQKMEALARLAGGVAGDFNNLLTVITGFGELLTSEMAPTNPLRRFAEEILIAAERAAALTRRLLAFGKGYSQSAAAQDLDALLLNLQPALQKALGANCELVLLPRSHHCRIKIDPGQLEQILVNLATNAAEAMPSGGKLIVETSDIEVTENTQGRLPDLKPGQYALIAVTDNGVGMDAETRRRLFEPFFTTKKQGLTAGLGLSIVYGIVRQRDGHISVYSQPGAGTIFEIYFPRAKELADPFPKPAGRGPRGTETILIADDEEAVRKLVHAVLATNGYRVLEARDGKEALDLFCQHAENVDMVLTDIVMPQMNGYELGSRIEQIDPGKRIMFMSGFRDAKVPGEYETKRPFLNKPFTPDVLLKSVREALDARL